MKLESKDIRARLRENFPGNLLFMPIHMDDSRADRSIAQLTRHPQISATIVSTEPRVLERRGSLHLKGIIHHDAKLEH